MNLFRHFRDRVVGEVEGLVAEGGLPPGLETARIAVEPPRDPGHGDVTTNAAMVLAAAAGLRPRDLAAMLLPRLAALPHVEAAEIAGPGFINLRLGDAFWHARLADILTAGTRYGDSALGAATAVNVEYVSANPTGPLHVGHGRGAVVGDALASLLDKAGFAVTREYYVNDAGAQVDKLADAAYWRYLQALPEDDRALPGALRVPSEEMPDIEYKGEYLVPVGQALAERHGAALVDLPHAERRRLVRDFAVEAMMGLIRDDLALLGIRFDVVSSERALVEQGGVDAALDRLDRLGLIYTGVLEPPKGKLPDDWEPRPQTLFRATRFGDDVDRPLRKSDGSWTYFATDIAYHLDKFRRGHRTMIDVWGADHGGYVKRMKAAVQGVTEGEGMLDVKLCQMVNLLDGGQPVKMSKRAGTFVTLRDVVERVGRGVFRFIMLTRRNDAQLDFDFEKVTEQSRENPVFYVQYAHARCRSVFRHAAELFGEDRLSDRALAAVDPRPLTDPGELALIRAMAGWPRLVESAAEAHEPHRVAFYLQELAALFHLFWNKGNDDARLRFIHPDDHPLTLARLALVRGVQLVIASGLEVIGVEPAEELR
ncbi:MAG: arginine--tRNA ligase [Rhodospirillales bacterium]